MLPANHPSRPPRPERIRAVLNAVYASFRDDETVSVVRVEFALREYNVTEMEACIRKLLKRYPFEGQPFIREDRVLVAAFRVR